jgi:hypothetical protein
MDRPDNLGRRSKAGMAGKGERGRGGVDRARVRHVKQHELDTADRLASRGFHVVFRRPNDESTADAYVNGVRAEFKWSSSSNPDSIERRITRKRKLKGPRYVLDVTGSPLTISEVALLAQRLCERYPRDGIASIMMVDGSTKPVTIEKAGEEVPQWRM